MGGFSGKKIALVSVAVLVLVAIAGYVIAQNKMKAPIEDKIAEIQKEMAGTGSLEYGKISVNPFTRKAKITNIKMADYNSQDSGKIDSINLNAVDIESDGIPNFLNVSIDGLEIQSADFQAFQSYPGVDEDGTVRLDSKIDYVYVPDERRLDLNNFYLNTPGLGSASLSLSLGNVDLTPEGIFSLIFSWPNLVFNGGELNVEGHELFRSIFEEGAREQGISYSRYMKNSQRETKRMKKFNPGDRAQSLLDDIVVFAEDPQGFSIKAYPEKPVTIKRFINEPDMNNKLEMIDFKHELKG